MKRYKIINGILGCLMNALAPLWINLAALVILLIIVAIYTIVSRDD